MNNLFAGILAFFVSIFHGGTAKPVTAMQPSTIQQQNVSGPSSGSTRNRNSNLPAGEQRFFGTVTTINGNTITLQTQMRRAPSGTPTTTSEPTRTITLDSSTTYAGGTQSDITVNTRIAGVTKTNTDGSLTAVSVQINPTITTGLSPNVPAGSQPFFGQVGTVNGTTLTVQRQSRNGNGTTFTVTITDTTEFKGGTQSDIKTGTRIGGYGKSNTDGSITAEQMMLNPAVPGRRGNGNQDSEQ